jgi:cyclophilin family peptidyl-prolyl cis-trans isomerase
VKQLFSIVTLLLLGFNASASTLVQFRTVFGDLDVELYDQDKPATVQNFIRYVRSGLYQDGIIHRCVPTFVIQGGGYYVANRHTTNAGIAAIATFPPITNEFGIGKTYSNVYGRIAMAKRGGDTNSASSQWFFNLTNNAFLDAGPDGFFTVFGKVVRGTNVLNVFKKFKASSPTNTIVSIGGPLTELPVLRTNLTYDDLIYVDVSLLNVQVTQLANRTHQISWNSVAGRTNYVEFTTNLPPTWRSLLATNGTGNPISVVDPTADLPKRFYRVRVNY